MDFYSGTVFCAVDIKYHGNSAPRVIQLAALNLERCT